MTNSQDVNDRLIVAAPAGGLRWYPQTNRCYNAEIATVLVVDVVDRVGVVDVRGRGNVGVLAAADIADEAEDWAAIPGMTGT